jgi:hypothetical protein
MEERSVGGGGRWLLMVQSKHARVATLVEHDWQHISSLKQGKHMYSSVGSSSFCFIDLCRELFEVGRINFAAFLLSLPL